MLRKLEGTMTIISRRQRFVVRVRLARVYCRFTTLCHSQKRSPFAGSKRPGLLASDVRCRVVTALSGHGDLDAVTGFCSLYGDRSSFFLSNLLALKMFSQVESELQVSSSFEMYTRESPSSCVCRARIVLSMTMHEKKEKSKTHRHEEPTRAN